MLLVDEVVVGGAVVVVVVLSEFEERVTKSVVTDVTVVNSSVAVTVAVTVTVDIVVVTVDTIGHWLIEGVNTSELMRTWVDALMVKVG